MVKKNNKRSDVKTVVTTSDGFNIREILVPILVVVFLVIFGAGLYYLVEFLLNKNDGEEKTTSVLDGDSGSDSKPDSDSDTNTPSWEKVVAYTSIVVGLIILFVLFYYMFGKIRKSPKSSKDSDSYRRLEERVEKEFGDVDFKKLEKEEAENERKRNEDKIKQLSEEYDRLKTNPDEFAERLRQGLLSEQEKLDEHNAIVRAKKVKKTLERVKKSLERSEEGAAKRRSNKNKKKGKKVTFDV